MIRLRPDTDAWRLLALVVAEPGRHDAEALGDRLWRPRVGPGAASVLSARAQLAANQAPRRRTTVGRVQPPAAVLEARAAAAAGARVWSRQASALLGRLVELGLVAPVQPARLSAEWADREWGAALPEPGEAPSAELLEELGEALAVELGTYRDIGPAKQPSEHGPRLVAALLGGPLAVRDWLGPFPSGACKRAADRLVSAGVVLRSGLRWPTEAGIARIEAGS